MSSEVVLIVWSALALAWWLVAWWLVTASSGDRAEAPGSTGRRTLTVFKPLAPLGTRPFRETVGLESFIGQLDEGDELLLGVHEPDRETVQPFIDWMRAQYPRARLKIIWRDEPDAVANPKVAWLKILAPHADSELWLWSDADIVAPPGFLRAARAEYAVTGARMMTWPYVIREIGPEPALLDALFVNAEFFPGVLLLRRLGPVDFGLGAAMLFLREDFARQIKWEELGRALADDFFLGRQLRPVRIGRMTVTTDADAESWRAAFRHYFRWSKTIRWNRPLGTLARLVVLPVLGWIAMIVWHPAQVFGWLGLFAVMQMDVGFAALICVRVGCRLHPRHFALMELWSLGRVFVWLICWPPGPVIWRGRTWWAREAEDSAPPLPARSNRLG